VNFGLFFTLWDRLLGTLRFPSERKHGGGDIGIQDCPHFPQVYARQLAVPFDPNGPCVEASRTEASITSNRS
jgi:sterol desaturase/sphingolipid hydroxylase (fatty acid hydroxylase superfamily)